MIINLSEFISRGDTIVRALNHACLSLCDGDTLRLDLGDLDIYRNGAYQKYYCISNNDKGEKSIAFPLIGKRNVVLDGCGSNLLFHGSILPFVIENCSGITVKNLSIDYDYPEFTQAEILEAEPGRMLLQFGKEFPCRVQDSRLAFRGPDGEVFCDQGLCMEFDRETGTPVTHAQESYFFNTVRGKDHGPLQYKFREISLRQVTPDQIEICGDLRLVHTPGNIWVCNWGDRNYPGIFVSKSENITLENIDLYHTLAMGVIVNLSENITLSRLRAGVREGSDRLVSTKIDATHFVNCRGRIELRDCSFHNMMDNACNIHGTYLANIHRESDHTFSGSFGHHQQVGSDLFRPGDRARLIDAKTQATLATVTVEETLLEGNKKLFITTAELLPELPEPCVAENISTAPEVLISNVEVSCNNPGGFLLSSPGKTLVENCRFSDTSFGIAAGMDMTSWFESGAIGELTIKNCEFRNCSLYPILLVQKHTKEKPQIAVFGDILVENNRFLDHGGHLMRVENAESVTFRGNTASPDVDLTDKDAIRLFHCTEVDIHPIKE